MLFIEFVQYTDSNCLYVGCLLNFYSTLTLTVYMYVFIEFVQYTHSSNLYVCCLLNLYSTLTVTVYMYILY
jgi:hypothetical protein